MIITILLNFTDFKRGSVGMLIVTTHKLVLCQNDWTNETSYGCFSTYSNLFYNIIAQVFHVRSRLPC